MLNCREMGNQPNFGYMTFESPFNADSIIFDQRLTLYVFMLITICSKAEMGLES